MVQHTCAIYGCRSGYHPSKKDERLGTDPYKYTVRAMNPDWKDLTLGSGISKTSGVCDLHFAAECFTYESTSTKACRKNQPLKRRRLIDGAVPMIFSTDFF
jgi:THAP domain